MRKLLPPHLVAILVCVSVALGLRLPLAGPLLGPIRVLGLVAVVAGAAITVGAARYFARLSTNIKTFDEPGQLVADGLFRFSRNPMYLGFLVLLVGVAIVVGVLSAWIGPIVFWAASQFWYIPFEERKMEAAFDDDYRIYREGVRRWVGVR